MTSPFEAPQSTQDRPPHTASELYYGHVSTGAPPKPQPHSSPNTAVPLDPEPVGERLDRLYWARRSAESQPWGEFAVGGAVGVGVMVFAIAAVVGAIACLFNLGQPLAAVAVLLGAVGAGSIAALFAFFWALCAACVATPLVGLSTKLCGIQARSTPVGCFAGGATGLLMGLLPLLLTDARIVSLDHAVAVLIPVMMVTVAAQLGAGWFPAVGPNLLVLGPWLRWGKNDQRGRFSLRQALGAMTVVSVLLALLQATGAFTSNVMALLFGWLILQALTWLAAVATVDHWWRKKLRKANGGIPVPSRST